jgi:hypothetical protein
MSDILPIDWMEIDYENVTIDYILNEEMKIEKFLDECMEIFEEQEKKK